VGLTWQGKVALWAASQEVKSSTRKVAGKEFWGEEDMNSALTCGGLILLSAKGKRETGLALCPVRYSPSQTGSRGNLQGTTCPEIG